MRELSVFADESGSEDSRYYLLTLVLHDQDDDLSGAIAAYERSLAERGLPDVPMHASPLMNGHGDYEGMPLEQRKRLLSAFFVMLQRMPLRYRTLSYRKDEFPGRRELSSRMRRDIVNLIFDELEYFQSFDRVKVYYDNGQGVVTDALYGAADYALGTNAVERRTASPAGYRLFQAADLICTLELAALKYERGEETPTDEKVFGTRGRFKKLYLRHVRRKLL